MESKSRIRKLSISNIVFYILMMLSVFLILNIISQKSDKVYNIIGFRTYTVLSGSMEPNIDPGDLVVTIKSNNFKEGDIITFNNKNQVITHRIEEIRDTEFITKGDNNNSVDSDIVVKNNIIGKVVLTIPKVGYIFKFLSQSWVIAVELILLGFIIIFNSRGK